jgi:hypothetical protein
VVTSPLFLLIFEYINKLKNIFKMSKSVYMIKKTMVDKNGKKIHVLMTDNHSEILELPYENIANKMVDVMNANTDSGCIYEVITIGNNKN